MKIKIYSEGEYRRRVVWYDDAGKQLRVLPLDRVGVLLLVEGLLQDDMCRQIVLGATLDIQWDERRMEAVMRKIARDPLLNHRMVEHLVGEGVAPVFFGVEEMKVDG